MRRTRALFLVLATLVLMNLPALAQTGGGYDLTWWTIDGGGGTVTGNGYTLSGTAGQPDAGAALTGGGYALTGGFWSGSSTGGSPGGGNKLYLPVIMRS